MGSGVAESKMREENGAGGGIRTHEGLRHRVLSPRRGQSAPLPIRPGSGTPAVPTLAGCNPSGSSRDKLRLFAAGQLVRASKSRVKTAQPPSKQPKHNA